MTLNQKKKFTAGLSVASNTILVIGKFVIGISINSVSVISEAVHSGMDLIAAIIAFFAVRESGKPPDHEHPFGHGKAEAISGAFEGLLIYVAIAIIVYEAIAKIVKGTTVASLDLGLLIMAVSAIMNTIVSRQLFKISRKTESLALEADALHLSTDVLTSVGVFAGLLLIRITHLHILDPLIALGVALVIGHAAYGIIKRSIRDLMDEKLSSDELEVIEKVLREHSPHFIGFHDLRSRKSGNIREIDLHLVQCRQVNLADAHRVCDHLEEELHREIPLAHLTIHVEPCEEDCEEYTGTCKVDIDEIKSHISGDGNYSNRA